MLFGVHGVHRRAIALAHHRQQLAVIIGAVVAPFLIDRQKAGKFHHLPIGPQHDLAGAIGEVHRGALHLRRCHLAGHGALEDQIVEPPMIARPGLVLAEIGRADRFMRFLRILRLSAVKIRFFRNISAVEPVRDGLARIGNGAAIHLHPVGPHIGDRAVFIELLRHAHGVAGGKAELARSLLLQRGRGERRRGTARDRLGLDLGDDQAGRFHRRLGLGRNAFAAQRQALQLLAIELRQACVERLSIMLHPRGDGPIFLRLERLDLALAFRN